MTAQLLDTLEQDESLFMIARVQGPRLFDPNRFGLRPTPPSTACMRGFRCHFALRDEHLVLDRLFIHAQEPLPTFFRPERIQLGPWGVCYLGMNHGIDFTGSIWAVAKPVPWAIGQMLTVRAPTYCRYEDVTELFFEDGLRCGRRDHSARARRDRDNYIGTTSWLGAAMTDDSDH